VARTPETQQLIALFNAGRIHDVELEARKLVALDPDFGFGWMALGVALQMQGGDALPMLHKAVALLPDDAEAHNNLGNALRARGQLQDALRCYRRAVELKPDFAEAHSNLGNVFDDLGQLEEAVRCHRRALEINPDVPEAHNWLGIALKDLGRLDEAVQCYQRALALRPEFAEAHGNLGNALKSLGRLEEAIASHRRAVALAPDSAAAHGNLGIALNDLGQLREAVQCHRRALELEPNYAEAHSNLGTALGDLGQLEEAVACHRRALELKPGFPGAHLNLGNALKDLGRLGEALPCYRRALELKPDYVDARSNLLFAMGFLQAQPALAMREEAERYGNYVARSARPFSDWPGLADPDPDRALNVGLVSGDLRNHPVGFFIEGVVTALARDRLKLAVYQTYAKTDEVTERLRRHIPRWAPVMGIADEKLAQRIRADGIDILVDLSGHSAHNRLPAFAWKPAPVQLSWLGYFATTGVPGMDYVLVDPWSVPPGEEAHFTEEVWRLPQTRQCFTPPEAAVEVAALPAQASGQVTFGSFNQLAKLNDAVLEAWARVLRAAPRARLFLKANQLNDAAVQEELRARFARQGIAGARLLFEGFSSRAEYLASYHRVDVALDTFPYPGGTTTMEAMWMGVPVLTLRGDRMLSHQGECLLMNAGLKDWIATDVNDYVSRAVHHAADLAALAKLRLSLRQQLRTSPLLDAPRFARHFEAALRSMWRRRCANA
jgi:predicted O-linked N-acetylglucosamine transferase (SPINDLY family)